LLQKQFSESTKNQPKPPDHDDDKLSEYHDDEEFEKHYAPRKKGQSFREAMQVDAKQRQKPQAIKKMQGDSEVQDYIGEGPEQHCMSCDKNLTRILRLEDENHALSRELVALNAKMEYRTKNMEGQAETWKTEALDILRVQEDAKKELVSKLEQKDRELGCQEWRIAILEAQAEKLKKLIA
jgi:hypothetical protein